VDEEIYRRPRDYDLEHEDDDEDVAFYVELTKRPESKADRRGLGFWFNSSDPPVVCNP
jgi:hypothetical protein